MADTSTVDDLRRAMETLTESYRDQTEEQRVRASLEEAVTARSRAAKEGSIKAGQQATAALSSFSKTLLTTEAGMTKYNTSIHSAGDAAYSLGKAVNSAAGSMGALGKVLGPLGIAVGGLIKLFAMGMELVNKQNDAMIKAYDTLSEFGATVTLTTDGLLKIATASGYTSHNLDTFAKSAASLNTDFIALGSGASAGFAAFGRLSKITQEQRNQYNRLGTSQDAILKSNVDFVKVTSASAIAMSKSPEALQKESRKYLDSLIELSALTGASADQQKGVQVAAAANASWQIHNAMLAKEAAELKLTVDKEGTSAGGKAAQERLNQIKLQQENEKKIYSEAGLAFGKESKLFTGVMQRLASNGEVWTEESAALVSFMPEFGRVMDGVKNKTVKLGQATDAIYKDTGVNVNRFGKQLSYSSADMELLALNGKLAAGMVQRLGSSAEDTAKENAIEILKKRAGLGLYDRAKEAQNAQLTVELQARQAMDQLTKTISGPLTNAFTSFMKVMSYIVKGLAKVAGFMLGDDSIVKMFETKEDVQVKLSANKKEVEESDKEIAKEQRQQATYQENISQEGIAKGVLEAAQSKSAEADRKFLEFKDPNDKVDRTEAKEIAAAELKRAEREYATRKRATQQGALNNAVILEHLEAKRAAKLKEREELTRTYEEKGGVLEKDKKEASISEKISKDQASLDQQELINIQDQRLKIIADSVLAKEKISIEDFDKLDDERKEIIRKKVEDARFLEEAKLNKLKDKLTELKSRATQKAIEDFEKEHPASEETETSADKSRFTGEKTEVGKIGAFTPEQSKSYANTVARRENDSGDIGKENKLGYAGKYQFGAEALASVGILDAQKYAELKKQSKTNKQIMNDSSVWANPGGRAAFLKDEKLQDSTFNKHTEMNLRSLQKAWVVDERSSPEKIAGYLMAAHLVGASGATDFSRGKDKADANGIRASEYYKIGEKSLKQGKNGGLFSGPSTGYPVELHGDELVTPIADLQHVNKRELSSLPQPADFSKAIIEMMSKTDSTNASTTTTNINKTESTAPVIDMAGVAYEILGVLSDKMDTMIDKLASSNDIQDELLRYSRA